MERDKTTFTPLPTVETDGVAALKRQVSERMRRTMPRLPDGRSREDRSLARSAKRAGLVEILLRAGWAHRRLLELALNAENCHLEVVLGLAEGADELLGRACTVVLSCGLVAVLFRKPTALAKPFRHRLKELH